MDSTPPRDPSADAVPEPDVPVNDGRDDTVADFDEADLDEALDESFPASDPLPPPSRRGH